MFMARENLINPTSVVSAERISGLKKVCADKRAANHRDTLTAQPPNAIYENGVL
jgi:hypothetical protein